MKKNILLLEPNYKNKYPPIGLMKIATYYRMLGDNVVFYKGEFNQFVINEITEDAIKKFTKIDNNVIWRHFYFEIQEYLKKGNNEVANKIIKNSISDAKLIELSLKYFRKYYTHKEYFKNPRWDRVHVATLFTFYWKQTIETVEFAKKVVKTQKEIYAGGVLASVVPCEFEKTTDIKPHVGLLNQPGVYDDNDIIIDELPLDYSILEEIEYKYPESGSYYGYMTRGCVNRCPFCAVPVIEPTFNDYLPISDKIKTIKENFGEQKNLLLLDNNVLASRSFNKIAKEIIDAGFYNGAKFSRPNYLDIAIDRIKENYNTIAYVRKSTELLIEFLNRLHGEEKQYFYDLLKSNYLLSPYTATKKAVLNVYNEIKDLYEQKRNKSVMNRYVDFNQGVDARLLTEDKIKLLSKTAIRPLRVAFDDWKLRATYEKAIRLAAKHGIKDLSNYILYNFKDEPIELYNRLKLNVELSDELGVRIYSFPMKYHPIMDPAYFQNRDYTGELWNRKFIRSIQSVLNSTKGKIGTGRSFFDKAFGQNEEEFYKILYMPETFIIYRLYCEKEGLTDNWWKEYKNLSKEQIKIANEVIFSNDFSNINNYSNDKQIYNVLKYYTITKTEIEKSKQLEFVH